MRNFYKLQWVFLLIILSYLHSQDSDTFDFDVEVGFGNSVRERYINPITITLKTNMYYTYSGFLEIRVKQTYDYLNSRSNYIRTVFMTSSSKKQITLYMRLNSYEPVWIDIGGKIKKCEYRRSSNKYVWLNISNDETFHFHINQKDFDYTSIHPAKLPSQSIGLEAVKGIMISEPYNVRFSISQSKALLEWVSTGGVLVLCDITPGNLNKIQWLKIFPYVVKKIDNSRFQELSLDNGKIFSIYGLSRSKNTKTIISEFVVPSIQIVQQSGYGYSKRHHLKNHIQDTLIGKLQLGWVWILLILYILCIGPLDHYIIKKTKRVTLTWIIFITAIIGFSLFAYFKSSFLKSGPMKIASFNFLDIKKESKRAIGTTFFGVYSTRNANYTISSPKDNYIDTLHEQYRTSNVYYPTILQKLNSTMINIRIPIYSCAIFTGQWYEKNPYNIEVQYKKSNRTMSMAKIDMTIKHDSHLKIEEAYLVTRSRYYRLTPLKNQKWQANPIRTNNFGYIKTNSSSYYYRRRWNNNDYTISEAKQLEFFMKAKEKMRFLSCSSKIQKNAYKNFYVEEEMLDLSHYINDEKNILLLFVKNSLSPVKIEKENPKKLEINLIRMVIASKGVQ